MNTSKEIFGQWKKESQLVVLKFPQSEMFYNSQEFRERILHSIENPRLQLDLLFNCLTAGSIRVEIEKIDLNRLNHIRKIS
jgi:hypothetical protein